MFWLSASSLQAQKNIQSNFYSQIQELPINFRKNCGQWDNQILYQGSSPGWNATVSFLKNKISFGFSKDGVDKDAIHNPEDPLPTGCMVWNINFHGSNENVIVSAEGEENSRTNYITAVKSALNVPDYRLIKYTEIYKNIDVRYYSQGQNLKYDFILKPQADVNNIHLSCDGIKQLYINEKGQLEINTPWGKLIEEIPESFQIINGVKKKINVSYRLLDDKSFGFEIEGRYNKNEELIIDPVNFKWSTFFGGTTMNQYIYDIAVDNAGYVYGTGYAGSTFPITSGVFLTTGGNYADIFVFKLNPAGNAVVYSTYVGGNNVDYGNGIIVNSAGEAFVTGQTWSVNGTYPTTAGAYDVTPAGSIDAIAFKLNSAGNTLLYSTFLGGNGLDYGYGIAINPTDEAYITGATWYNAVANFPTTTGAFQTNHGGSLDGFVCKLNSAGSSLLYSTLIGGTGADNSNEIAINTNGEAFITGYSASGNFPVTNGAYDTSYNGGGNGNDAIVVKLNSTGSALIYSTYVGGALHTDQGYGVVINSSDEAFVTGYTQSGDFPVTAGAYDTNLNGGGGGLAYLDAFALKLNNTGTTLLYSTYIGGADNETGYDITINDVDEVFIAGTTKSSDFPATSCAYDNSVNGLADLFVCKLSSAGNLLYASYFGGVDEDYTGGQSQLGIVVYGDCKETAYICGTSHSPNFPTTAGSYQPTKLNGGTGLDQPVVFVLEPSVTPGFTHTPNPTCGSTITFTNTSTGNCVWQSGTWSPTNSYWDFGDGTNSTSMNPVHSYTAAGTYNVKLVVSCPKDSIIIPIVIASSSIAAVGSGGSVCMGSGFQLSASGGTSYQWNPSTGLSNATIANPVANPASPTTYSVIVSLGGACPDTATVNVNVVSSPTVNISGNNSLCAGNSVPLNASGANNYSWGPSTGLSSTTGASVSASPSSPTTYTVIGTIGTCVDTNYITINVFPAINISSTFNSVICSGDSITLTAGGATSYNWLPSTGLSSSTGSSVVAKPLSFITYSVIGTGAGGCADTAQITILINNGPTITINGNNSVCNGSSVTLTATGGVTYTWYSSAGISSTTGNIISSTPATASTYTVIASGGNSCTTITTFSVDVNAVPVANAGNDSSICIGETVMLNASGGTSYAWYPTPGLSNTAISNPNASPVITSTYSVAVFNGPCSDTDEVVITVSPLPIADAGNNTTILIGASAILSASGGGTYSWHPSTGLSCVTCQFPTAMPQQTTKYYVTVTDNNGCTSLDSITVTVDIQCGEIFVPTAFSPNADGQNDVLFIYGNCIKTMTFKIYNRWGEKVFETNDITIGWEGIYKDELMGTQVFAYSLEAILITGVEILQEGNISLVR